LCICVPFGASDVRKRNTFELVCIKYWLKLIAVNGFHAGRRRSFPSRWLVTTAKDDPALVAAVRYAGAGYPILLDPRMAMD
jgi:hypothetical protein